MERLTKLVKKENKKRLEKAINDLKQTHGDDLINLWYYKEKLTNTQIKKYINKEMTEKEIKEKIKNKIIKEYEKRETAKINKIETIKNANDDILTINITVNWTKNRTWGYNPHATIFTNKEDVTEGKASGCGYDKESSAIAEALNKNNDILKLLYIAKNKKMTFKNHNNHDILGYGSGYYELPYFEGGVGVNSLMNIFRKLGYNITEHHTNSSNFYTIIKKGVK